MITSFSQSVKLGDDTFHIHGDSFVELSSVAERIRQMNYACGGEGKFRERTAEKKKGKSVTTVLYPEMVKYVDKLPFDNGEYRKTLVKLRISKQTEPEFEGWPYFIPKTQRWCFHDIENEKDYFCDEDGKWKEGSYDADTFTWKAK